MIGRFYTRHLNIIGGRCCCLRGIASAVSLASELFFIKIDVVLFDVDDGLAEEVIGFAYECWRNLSKFVRIIPRTVRKLMAHLCCAIRPRDCFTQSNETFKLSNRYAIRVLANTRRVVLTKQTIFLHKNVSRFCCQLI